MRESGENYLETILLLQKKLGCVRSIDIANKLDYSKPSVSRAMSILKKQDYITMDKSGFIELTEKGLKTAREIYERHTLIQEFLIETLGVEPDIAEQDACRIEHIISVRTFDRIREYVQEHHQS
ncbi:metal-dependent transcriptional regulator [Christensenella intestinihominis]|uniref:metal-dependent transcriptional regulator n=1 Tax=Christensenella intestinihominis TaxID=1851429 RepID=UPI00082B564F|nr:metal-dependent transcriptional regulator [Christensenella intestinihominis]